MTNHVVAFDDVSLCVEEHGPSDGPLAILLHGFPDTPLTFRHLAPYLVERGFRVLMPSLRGYAPSGLASTRDYSVSALASDANRLHEHFGGDGQALLIGHDWGAAATYPTLASEPDRWSRAVALSVPPLNAMISAFTSFSQLQRSWYTFFFQHPLSDMVVPLNDFDIIRQLWATWSPGYDGTLEVSAVIGALSGPGHLEAALSYYRAALSGPYADTLITEAVARIVPLVSSVPPQRVLYIHGRDDGCIGVDSTDLVDTMLAAGSRRVVVEGAGHFVHLEQPELVHREIGRFLDED